jgi:hypothetical protein
MTSSALTGNTSGLASATSSGLVGTDVQTFAGKKTFSTGALISGDSAGTTIPAGYIGYQVRGFTPAGSAVALTNGTWVDIISGGITLGVGTWDLSAIAGANQITTITGTRIIVGIGTVAGNSATGIVSGDSRIEIVLVPNVNGDVVLSIPQYRVTITSGTQAYYLKIFAAFTAGTMQGYGRLSAVLVG